MNLRSHIQLARADVARYVGQCRRHRINASLFDACILNMIVAGSSWAAGVPFAKGAAMAFLGSGLMFLFSYSVLYAPRKDA